MKADKETRKKAILVLQVCASNKCGTLVASRDLDIQERDVDRLVMDAFAYVAPAWNRWLGATSQTDANLRRSRILAPLRLAAGRADRMTPLYKHDCDRCKFLGVYRIGDSVVDLYACNGLDGRSVVARYSSGGLDYSSWPVDVQLPGEASNPLVEALRRLRALPEGWEK